MALIKKLGSQMNVQGCFNFLLPLMLLFCVFSSFVFVLVVFTATAMIPYIAANLFMLTGLVLESTFAELFGLWVLPLSLIVGFILWVLIVIVRKTGNLFIKWQKQRYIKCFNKEGDLI